MKSQPPPSPPSPPSPPPAPPAPPPPPPPSSSSSSSPINQNLPTNDKKEPLPNKKPRYIYVEEDEKDGDHGGQVLLTPLSLAQSLAPPRAPPVGSIHRNFLIGKKHHHLHYSTTATKASEAAAATSDQHYGQKKKHLHLFRKIAGRVAAAGGGEGSGGGGGTRTSISSTTVANDSNTKRYGRNHHHHHHHHRYHQQQKQMTLSKGRRLKPSLKNLPFLPHPHVPSALEIEDELTRYLSTVLTLSKQNSLRDSGRCRSISDGLVTMSVPSLAIANPSAAKRFLKLGITVKRISYGSHSMQEIHLYEPDLNTCGNFRGLFFFMHGGAWGSGLPWMYRLVASPFLDAGMTVAIVGYRTYPDANAEGQVEDMEQAAAELARRRPDLLKPPPTSTPPSSSSSSGETAVDETSIKWVGLCLSGHSSGAHISLLMLVDRIQKQLQLYAENKVSQMEELVPIPFDSYIGLSGPYDISHHFDYEAGRGVEEISPLKPVCGYTRENFKRNSPAIRLTRILTQFHEYKPISVDKLLPRMLLVHGVEDTIVPFTATSDCAKLLRACGASRCDELYLGKCGHEHTIMHFMLGGKVKNAVMEWLLNGDERKTSDSMKAHVKFSKLSNL